MYRPNDYTSKPVLTHSTCVHQVLNSYVPGKAGIRSLREEAVPVYLWLRVTFRCFVSTPPPEKRENPNHPRYHYRERSRTEGTAVKNAVTLDAVRANMVDNIITV